VQKSIALVFSLLCLLLGGSLAGDVPQDIGFPDAIYQDLTESDCRDCHGPILYERHHVSPSGQSGDCLVCHVESGGHLQTETNCLVCHPQTETYSPHHETDDAYDGLCAECHQANLVTDLQDIPGGDAPEYPELHTCSETCHNVPGNGYTHHNRTDMLCTDCHVIHGISDFWGCKGCHNEQTLHNIAPHRDACEDCHGGVVPDSIPPSEPVNPGIQVVDPNGTMSADTLLIAGDDFEPFDIDSRVDFDSTVSPVIFWGDSAIIAEVPDDSIGNYDVRVSNYLGSSNRVGFAITMDSPYNPIFDQMDCSSCHVDSTRHGFQSPDYTSCASCHVLHGDQPYSHKVVNSDCTACHQRDLWPEHNDYCDGCHESNNPIVVEAIENGNTSCTACHSSNSHVMNCQLCHTDKTWEEYVGREQEVHSLHIDRVVCGTCHMVPTDPQLEPTGQYCTICHEAEPYVPEDIPDIHRRHVTDTRAVPFQCMTCHGRMIADQEPTGCGLCHTDKTYPGDWSRSEHQEHASDFDCTACHQHPRDFDFQLDNSCVLCHDNSHVSNGIKAFNRQPSQYVDSPPTLNFQQHMRHKWKTQCWTCHGGGDVAQYTAGYQCTNCHTDSPMGSMKEIHNEHGGEAYMCWVCHDRLVPVYSLDQVNEP
jgi:hypothetical protein